MKLLTPVEPKKWRNFQVPSGQEFVLHSTDNRPARTLRTLGDLVEEINLIGGDQETFSIYVGPDHNFFADWVEKVFGEMELAAELRRHPTPLRMRVAIAKFLWNAESRAQPQTAPPPEDATRLLADVHPLDKRHFPVPSGQELVFRDEEEKMDFVVHTLEELSEVMSLLARRSLAALTRHANSQHNIFADWVETVFRENRLAAKLRFEPMMMTFAIERFLHVDAELLAAHQHRKPLFVGAPALAKVHRLFEQNNLPFPPIPSPLAEQFQIFGKWFFGTRLLPYAPYTGFEFFVQEFQQGQTPDYVAIAHDGQGVNSYALHFFLVKAPLGIFYQLPWGGVYTDPEWASAQLARSFEGAQRLITAVSQAVEAGRLTCDTPVMLTVSLRAQNQAIWPMGARSGFNTADGENIIEEMISGYSHPL